MVDFRRAHSERLPRSYGSPKAEIGEIDTRAPFQSVKAAVSLFGEVALSKERRTPRKSRLSSESVIDKETQLLLAEKEMNHIKQKLETAETTKAKAEADLESTKKSYRDLADQLRTLTESKQSAIKATEASKEQAMQLELRKSKNHEESDAKKKELNDARELYMLVASELDAAKQDLNNMRQDFDAALETKLAAFQQAAEAQCSAKLHSKRVGELTKEISAMKEAVQQVKFATQQVYQEQENIVAEKHALQISYKSAKEEAKKKLVSLREEHDPELTKYLEEKLMETTAEVECLQEEMKKVHAIEMDSVRVITAELNEATKTLQLVVDEECALRTLVSSIRMELEEVKSEKQVEMIKAKEAEREAVAGAEQNEELNEINEQSFRLQQLLSEIENATSEAEEMKKNAQVLKMEAEAADIAVQEMRQKLELALKQAEEAKVAEKMALAGIQALSAKKGNGNLGSNSKIKISIEEFESLKRKIEESEKMSETTIAAAMAELEAINARTKDTDQKLEASLKAVEEIKAATEEAENSASMADAAQRVIEAELARRRQQEQTVAS